MLPPIEAGLLRGDGEVRAGGAATWSSWGTNAGTDAGTVQVCDRRTGRRPDGHRLTLRRIRAPPRRRRRVPERRKAHRARRYRHRRGWGLSATPVLDIAGLDERFAPTCRGAPSPLAWAILAGAAERLAAARRDTADRVPVGPAPRWRGDLPRAQGSLRGDATRLGASARPRGLTRPVGPISGRQHILTRPPTRPSLEPRWICACTPTRSPELSFEAALDLAARTGCRAIEIAAGGQSSAPHMRLAELLGDAGRRRSFLDGIQPARAEHRGAQLLGLAVPSGPRRGRRAAYPGHRSGWPASWAWTGS